MGTALNCNLGSSKCPGADLDLLFLSCNIITTGQEPLLALVLRVFSFINKCLMS